MGVGEAIADAKLLDQAVDELATIAGQRPAITRAQKVDLQLQAARGDADRLPGDAARQRGCTSSSTG